MLQWEDKILGHIKKTADKSLDEKDFTFGKVISLEPLQIASGGLALFYENLYLNPTLLKHTIEFETLTGTISDSSTTITNGSITFKSRLKEGDYVVLKPVNEEKYIIFCKVEGGILT